MAERDLLVRILGDDRDLQRALKNTERSVQRIDSRTAAFGKNIKTAFAAAGVAVGAREFFRGVDFAIEAASDLNEQISKSNVVFGESAAVIKAWSESTAESIGISQRAAIGAAATFGAIFVNTGQAEDDAAEFSKTLVNLAGDMASFNNATTDDALNALRSGLSGEIEPLRRFTIFLTEATVTQEALRETHKKSAKELTQGEKIQARYNLILRQGAIQSGDYGRTADNLANQQRTLAANLDDVATKIGQALVPGLEETTEAANDLFASLKRLDDIDVTPGFDMPDEFKEAVKFFALPGVAFGRALQFDIRHPIGSVSGGEDPLQAIPGDISRRRDLAKQAQLAAKEAAKEALEADREVRRSTRAFNALISGLGLKLDKAGLTATTDDDLAVLREMERAIQRRIAREGRTFELVKQLTNVRLQISALVQQRAADAQQAAQDAWNATLDALDLDLEMAQATTRLDDDLAALRAIEQKLVDRIAAEGATTDLLRRLFEVRQDQAEIAKQLAEQKRERRDARLFEALGLTAEGEERMPSIGALRRRGRNLIDQLRASGLDPEKIAKFVDRISEIFTKKFDGASRKIRAAILAMFNDIAGALDEGGKGPLTKTSGLNTRKVLEGLGLSEEQINELRGRLSSVNTGGRQFAPGGGGGRGADPTTARPLGESGIVVENFVTVEIDGQKITATVTKQQQKARRRNPQQKRGPNRHK